MQINTRVIWVRDFETGEYGWRVKNFDWASNVGAAGLTHDILEHSRNDGGTYEEELTAYGRVFAYRFYTPYLYGGSNSNEKIQALGVELSDLLYPLFQRSKTGDRFLTTPKKYFKKITEETQPLYEMSVIAFNHLANEFDLSFLGNVSHTQVQRWILSWLVSGYRKAKKVIDESGMYGGDIYGSVYDTLKQQLPDLEPYIFEGAEISVQIETSRCQCYVFPINFKDY